MPHNGPGIRQRAVCTKDCVHGQIVVEEGFVGTAFKIEQVDRYTRPADAANISADADEVFHIMVGGLHEAPATGGLNAAGVGDVVYINPANNALGVTATAGYFPVGRVASVDAVRDVVKINSNAWQSEVPA